MRAQLGYGILAIGTAAAVLGVATLIAGLALRLPKLLELARRYVLVVLLAAIGAFAVMESALFAHDYSIKYVTENVARDARPLHLHGRMGSARRIDPALVARALGVRGRHHVALSRARPTPWSRGRRSCSSSCCASSSR